jgi:signal transduction histidine kinase
VEKRSRLGSVRVLFEDSDGALWAGSRYHGVEYLSETVTYNWTTTNGLSHNLVTAIAQDRSGAIWVGTPNGLNRFLPRQSTTHSTNSPPRLLPENNRPEHWAIESFFVKNGLGANRIHALFMDRDGTLWIGTAGGGLTRYRNGEFRTVNSSHGLHSDVVAQILEDDDANFWIASTAGIFRVSKQSVDAVLDGREPLLRCVAYGKKDGMSTTGYPGGFQPTCAKTRDGRLWFCTNGGVTVLDPKEARESDVAPDVHIESVVMDGTELVDGQGLNLLASSIAPSKNKPRTHPVLTIPPGAKRLEFHCAALSFFAPEQTQFKFRLEGYEDIWHEAGKRRVAQYTRVPPGKYVFHVKAANAAGVWNSAGTSLGVVVKPTWRQSIWFRVASSVLVAGFGAAIYYMRVSKLKKARSQEAAFSRQLIESQEAERKRIANELHDSLGQSLLIIKNRARRGVKQQPSMDSMQSCLNEIADTAGQAVEEVRTIARALRPYQLDSLGLTRALQGLIRQVGETNGFEIKSRIEPLDGCLNQTAEISLYRIVQESLNNVVKHAKATCVSVSADLTDTHVRLTVQDNGQGFSPSASRSAKADTAGFGLRGIEERVRLLNGQFALRSQPGSGTRLRIEISRAETESKA